MRESPRRRFTRIAARPLPAIPLSDSMQGWESTSRTPGPPAIEIADHAVSLIIPRRAADLAGVMTAGVAR